jgi:hypothetical protein
MDIRLISSVYGIYPGYDAYAAEHALLASMVFRITGLSHARNIILKVTI